MIYQELIQMDMEAANADDFFDQMARKLYKLGYVEDSFKDAIKQREEKFPTALPLKPYSVAIPHTDPKHIKKPFIAATRLKNSVVLKEMGNDDVEVDVKFIFMLGFHRNGKHVQMLQVLIDNFQNDKLMTRFMEAKTEKEYMEAILSMKGFKELQEAS